MHRRRLPWVAVLVLLAALLALGGACSQDLEPAHLPAAVDATQRNELRSTSRVRGASLPAASHSDGEDESDDAPTAEPRPPAVLVVHVVGREDARPIAGADVRYIHADDTCAATTDVDGRAILSVPRTTDDVDDRREWFEVSAAGHVRDSLGIAVPSGTEQHATVSLAPGYAIEGSVRDMDGRPIPGARVVAAEGGVCISPPPEVAETTTDATGDFRLDGLSYWVPSRITISDGRHVARQAWRSSRDTGRLDVVLLLGGTVRGTVRGSDGTAVPWASVYLDPVGGETPEGLAMPLGGWDEQFEAGEDGSFEIHGVPFGVPFTLVATSPGFMHSEEIACEALTAQHADRVVALELRAAAVVEVDLDFAEPHEPSVARMAFDKSDAAGYPVPGKATFTVRTPGTWSESFAVEGLAPVTVSASVVSGETRTISVRFAKGASISGVVVDDVGSVVGGAEVVIDSDRPWPHRTVSAPDGSFELGGLTTGSHTLQASASGHAHASLEDVAAPAKDVRCVLPRNGEAVLRLELPTGAKWPAERRITWNDYPVYVEDEGPWTGAPIVSSLPPGDYLVEINVRGFVSWKQSHVQVRAGQRTDLGDIELEAGLRIRGCVLDPDGRALSREIIWCGDQIVTTDADGRFVSPPLAPGLQVVRVQSVDGMVDAVVPIDLAEDSPPLEIRMIRGAVLRVVLTGVTAEEAESLYVELVAGGAEGQPEVRYDVDDIEEPSTFTGRFGPLRGRVEVARDDDVIATREIELRDRRDMTIEVAVPR